MNGAEGVARDQLHSIVQRIERLEEEIKEFNNDKRDIYAEAKANGFDAKALKAVVRLRKQDVAERQEHEAIVQTYMVALGMVSDDEEESPARVQVHAREDDDLPDHNPDTGERIERDVAEDEPSVETAASNSEPDQTSKSTAGAIGTGNTGVTPGRDPGPNNQTRPDLRLVTSREEPECPAFLLRNKEATP